MKCEICDSVLSGKQTKFCSIKCKNQSTNKILQDYKCQKARGLKRKKDLLKLKGGCCEKCGYKRNYAGLSFHHLDPTKKLFEMDIRACSNKSWNSLLEESGKCQLLCLICHVETHYPDLMIDPDI